MFGLRMMSPAQVDRCTVLCVPFFLAGVVCWFVDFAASGFMFVGLGAAAGMLTDWREERGLWMLACLSFLIFGSLYILFTFFGIADMIAGRAGPPGLAGIDIFISTGVLGYKARFLWTVTWRNYRFFAEQVEQETES